MDNTPPSEGATPASEASQPRVRLSSPADVLAVVPHVLGFHPAKSLVVIGAGGQRERVELGFRYDLPDPPDRAAAADIARHAVAVLTGRGIAAVIVVGYGPGRLVTPLVDAFAEAARPTGLRLREMLRVQDGRYWSYLCTNVDCCPPEGVAFDPGAHPASAVMTAAGLPAFPDRQARARTLAPPSGREADEMEQAVDRACDRAAALMARADRQRPGRPLSLVIEAGRDAVKEAIDSYRGGRELTDADAVAWLAVTMANLAVRDDAWARMEPEHREAHLRLWTDVVRRVGDLWVPGPAALLAFTAWQCGDGALANIAIERALAADPGYSLALLLRDVIDAGVPPSAARVPMTPDEVARSYEEAQDGRAPARPADGGGAGPQGAQPHGKGRGGRAPAKDAGPRPTGLAARSRGAGRRAGAGPGPGRAGAKNGGAAGSNRARSWARGDRSEP